MRPCWVVLTSMTVPDVRRALPPNLEHVTVSAGTEGYTAIIEMEPGSECCGELELAAELSERSRAACYVLWTDLELPSAQVFEGGARVGDLAAWPDHVALALGCSFPGLTDEGPPPADVLEVVAEPEVPPDDPKIDFMTASQWAREMRLIGWADAFDPAPEVVAQVRAALGHPRAEVRRVAAALAGCCTSTYSHPDGGLPEFLSELERVAASDSDAETRAAARRSVGYLRGD